MGGALDGAGVTGGAEGLRTLKEPRVIDKKLVKKPNFIRKLVGDNEVIGIAGADDAVKAKGFFGRSVDKVRGIFGQKPVAEGGKTIGKKLDTMYENVKDGFQELVESAGLKKIITEAGTAEDWSGGLSKEQYQEIVDKELKELKEKINNFKKEGETK